MQRKLKNHFKMIFRICTYPWYWLVFRLAGVRYDPSWTLHGMPFVRCGGKGSKIEIGRRLVACSKVKQNAIGVFQRVIIRTCAPNAKIEIGEDVGMSGCTISACSRIRVGSRVLIGSGALIIDSDHHAMDIVQRTLGDKGLSKEVFIEDDVFIGARAIILKGVNIGRGAIVGAGAVVTNDVGPFELVAGNPARIVRKLYSGE